MSDDRKSNSDDTEIITENDKSSLNLEQNLAGLLCYLGTVITGIIFLIIEKENKFVRFHAMQSICFFAAIWIASFILGFVPFVGWLVASLLSLAGFVGWIVLMFKAYNNEYFKVPLIGDLSEDFLNKI